MGWLGLEGMTGSCAEQSGISVGLREGHTRVRAQQPSGCKQAAGVGKGHLWPHLLLAHH